MTLGSQLFSNQARPLITALVRTTAASEQIAALIDPAVTVTDPDNTTAASAMVSITGNFHFSEGVLAFVNDSSMMAAP